MSTVDYLPIANAGGAAVESQAAYLADATLPTGWPTGIVPQLKFNKAWRQSSMIAAAVANYISQQLGIDVLDDGNVANLVANLTNAIVTGANIKPARTVTVSANMNIAAGDYRIGFDRTVAPAALNAQLPTLGNGAVGQEFVVEDLAANFDAFPVTLVAPAGQSFAGEANFVLNRKRQSATIAWYGNNLWSIKT
jgi:hypothetical protein